MSICYSLNSNGRFINEIGKIYKDEVTAASFSCRDEGKALIDFLFDAVSGYEKASTYLTDVIDTYFKSVDVVMRVEPECFWRITPHTGSAHGFCGHCGTSASINYTYITAQFDSSVVFHLSQLQESARQLKIAMPPAFFRRDVVRARCTQFMQSFLENMPGNEGTTQDFSICEARDPIIVNGNIQYRALFKFLLEHNERIFSWGHHSDVMQTYADDMKRWLLYTGTMLMRRADYSDHIFVFNELIGTRSPSVWEGPVLVQFPKGPESWNPSLVDHYFQMLHVAVGFGTMTPDMYTNDCIRKTFTSVAAFDKFDEGKGDNSFRINDGDLMEILFQLRIAPLFSYILGLALPVAQAASNKGRTGTPSELPFARAMFMKLLLLVRIACKATMSLRLTGSVRVLLKFSTIIVSKLADMCTNGGGILTWLCGKGAVENAVLIMAYAIVHSGLPGVWNFIRLLPLHILSERSCWGLFSILHMLPAAELKHSNKEWISFVRPKAAAAVAAGVYSDPYLDDLSAVTDDDAEKKANDADTNSTLVSNLVKAAESQESLRYAVITLGTLSENWGGALTRACMNSLFRIAFLSKGTDEGVSGFVTNFIGAMCSKNIDLIKDVVTFLPVGFAADKADIGLYRQLVDRIPFGDWDPEPEYARTVAWWTNADIDTPKHVVGRHIMDAVQWPKVSIKSNRAVAYALTRAAIKHRTSHDDSSVFTKISEHSDFKKYRIWTSDLLGSLSYYVVGSVVVAPTTGILAKDVEIVERDARMLRQRLQEADAAKDIDSALRKTNPEELFALFMLSPFGADSATWAREGPFVMKLLRALIEARDVDEFKTPVLCQLVPYVFANVEDKEALKACVIPDYSSIVRKYVERKAGITFADSPDTNKVNRICHQLISSQIDTYSIDVARSFGDFWLKLATYKKKWFSDIPSAAILSVFLQSWFALKEGELPLPEYEKTIATHITSWVNSKSISMIPLKARNLIIVSPLPNFPYMLFETLYYETKYLFDHKALNGDILAKKARQWSLYTIELPDTCEIGVLFWQMTTYLYSRAINDKKCSSSALKPLFRDKDRKKIVDRLQELKASTTYSDLAEFYEALREYFWVTVQDAKDPESSALNKAANDEKRNWLLMTAINNSPLEYTKNLMLPYVDRADIALKIRVDLAYKGRNIERRRLEYTHFSFGDILEKCPIDASKPFPNFSPSSREAVWDSNRSDRDAFIIARDPGITDIIDTISETLTRDLTVDSVIQSNDSFYEQIVRNLYRDDFRSESNSMRCGCGAGFITVRYSYTTSVINQDALRRAADNRRRAFELYNDINKVDSDTVIKVVLLDDTVHKLTLVYDAVAQQADVAGIEEAVAPPQIADYTKKLYDNALRGIGTTSVSTFFLTNMLKRVVFDLTCSFVRMGYGSAQRFLTLALTDKDIGKKIAPLFAPWVVRSGFVKLLHMALSAYTKDSTIHEYILRNFDLYEWARIGRPLKEKTAALTEVSTAFPYCNTDTFLCDYVVDSFEGALRASFADLVLHALSLFIHNPSCPATRLWGALSGQDMSFVSTEQARDTLKYISDSINKFRGSKDFHYKTWGSNFTEFVDAFTAQQVRTADAANNESFAKSLFTEALKIFTPCLDAVGPNSPWNRGAPTEEIGLITPFTVGFAMLIRKLVDAAPRLGAYFVSEAWRYVTETLKTLGPGNLSQGVPQPFIQDTLLNALAGVPWGVWLPPRRVFNDIIAMAGEHIGTHTRVPGFSRFVVSFGTAVSWSKADYYSPDTLLELHCALTRGLALYPEPVERTVYDQVHRLNTGSSDRVGWDILSTEMIKPVMDESVRLLAGAPRHKDELFKWFVLYVYIAQTCGIKIASPDSGVDYCKDDGYYADVLTSDNFAAFVDYFSTLQRQDSCVCPGLNQGPINAILCAYKGFFDGSAGTLESVESAMNNLFGLYNYNTKNTDIHPSVVKFLQNNPECACLLSQYLCRCVYDTERLLPSLEDILGCYFTKFDDWGQVTRHVSIPIKETAQSFIEKALVKSYYLSFFAAFRLAYFSGDVLKLSLYNLIETVTVTPGKERGFFLFCYALLKQTCTGLSIRPTTKALLYEGAQLKKLEDLLDTIAQDKVREGFLGKIGLGKESELDTVFRVCAKTLSAFIKAQLVEEDKKKKLNVVRIVEKDPFSVKENLSLYKDVSFKKYIKRLGDSYIARVSEYFYEIMSNPEYTIFSYSRLLASIAECVYQGKAREFSCFRNDVEVEINVKSGASAITEEMRNPDNSDKTESAIALRNDCAHLGNLGSLGFNQRTVFEVGGTDVVISLVCSPDYQKDKRDIQVALTALWELVLVDFDIQAHAISKDVVPAILKIAKSTSAAAEAAYRLLSALLVEEEIYKKIITDEIIAKAAESKSTKVFAAALARTEDEEVVSLRTKETCSGARALRCTNKKCLDKKVFFCPHCNVQQHFYVCITCTKTEGRTVQFCDVCWAMCHKQGGHEFKRIFAVGKCTCKNFTCKANAVTSSVEFNHMDPALISQWVRSACQFGEATAEIFRQKNVSGKKLLSMSKSDMASIGLSDDQIAALRKSLSPYKSFFNRAASLFTRNYSYVDALYNGECKFSFPELYSHPSSLSEALTAAQEVLPPDVQVNTIYTQCLSILTAMKNDPERMGFIKEFSLTDDEVMAVLMYTYDISAEDAESAANNNGCFSVQFNRLLRQYTPTMQNSLSGYMYFTIAALKKIPAYGGAFAKRERNEFDDCGVYVYRGVPDFSVMPNFEEVYAQGREITWPSFSSVSADIVESRRFACSGEDPSLRLLFVIRVKKSARDIHCISAFSSESEVLIAPGTVFRVVSSIEWSDPESVNRIELEEVSTKFF